MNELALFAGAGGGILGGVLLGWRTVAAVEIDPYCREILLRRQRDGVLDLFPIWDDIRTFDGTVFRGTVDVVSAGFPCQPFSVAGARRGADDERNMWPDTIRVLREVEPRFALLENVPGLVRTDYFGEILGNLADAGFDAEWEVVSAAEVGAPHLRKRLWIAARLRVPDSDCGRLEGERVSSVFDGQRPALGDDLNGRCGPSPDPAGARLEGAERPQSERNGTRPTVGCCWWWEAEPAVGRVVDGLAHRVGQLRALGNGQVPRVAAEAWRRLRGGQ